MINKQHKSKKDTTYAGCLATVSSNITSQISLLETFFWKQKLGLVEMDL